MDEIEKVQLISDAASILVLHAASLRSTSVILVALKELINRLEEMHPTIILDLEPEIQLLFGTLRSTQKQIQKAGTAQGLFVEELKDKFGFGGGKPTNVRKGNVRKKD